MQPQILHIRKGERMARAHKRGSLAASCIPSFIYRQQLVPVLGEREGEGSGALFPAGREGEGRGGDSEQRAYQDQALKKIHQWRLRSRAA
jgi:hypothetical protein